MDNIRLFCYGTLCRGKSNFYILHDCKMVDTGWLKGFEMWQSIIPYVCRSKDPEKRVYGEIYEVPVNLILNKIDILEGHPDFYRREFVDQLGGVWIYLCDSVKWGCVPVENGIWR